MKKTLLVFIIFILIIIQSYAESWDCIKCGAKNEAHWNFCNICGTSKPKQVLKDETDKSDDIIQCVRCNHFFSNSLKYCPECGIQNYYYSQPEDTKQIQRELIEEQVEPVKIDIPKEKKIIGEVNKNNYLLMSTFCPGLAQFKLENRFKGISLAVLTYGSFIYGYHNKRQADTKYENIKGVTLTKHNYSEYMHYKKQVKDYDKKSKQFYAIGAIIWLYNIFDANNTISEHNLNQKRLQINFNAAEGSVTARF